jgi:competence protein ComEC
MAVAMVTGHEAWITTTQTDQMRDSGLAHILSISGLHMAIVGGFAFALMRLLIAAIPPLALRINGKKLAAGVALTCVGLYLLVSGAPPAAERAAITAAVAFGAIMIDRRALSLHALSVAALIILFFQPEAAAQAGFQMSFAATAALVALAGLIRRPVREISVPLPIRLVQGAAFWFFGGLLVSLVAGMATAPFAMHHFNRVSTYGLPANLAVEPLSSLVIMPFLALGAALTPLGWGWPFLKVAGWGLEAMQAIAAWFAGLPMANVTIASGPPAELLVAFVGVMLVCLWRGWLRWLGLPLACTVLIWPKPAPPALWVADDGAQIGMRSGGQAIVLRPATQAFAADLWSRRRGLGLVDDDAVRGKFFDCNRNRCLPLAGAPVKVAARFRLTPISADEWSELCNGAEIIVLRTERTAPCPGAVVLSGTDFAAGGAAELYRRNGAWAIAWAQPLRGRRPWAG